MSREQTLGWIIGESMEDRLAKDRGYTIKTNDKLAGDNASPLPGADIAAVGFKIPGSLQEPVIADGVAFRQKMPDQLDDEDRLSFKRR